MIDFSDVIIVTFEHISHLVFFFATQADVDIEYRRPETVIIEKEKKECKIIMAVSGDHNTTQMNYKRLQNTRT